MDPGESYHRSDYTIDCNSAAYEAYAVVAIFFIFIYPIGVPTCFGALLFWNRDVLGGNLSGGQHANKWWYGDGETLDFLVDGYRAETFWFELVEFLRKILMAGARRIARCVYYPISTDSKLNQWIRFIMTHESTE